MRFTAWRVFLILACVPWTGCEKTSSTVAVSGKVERRDIIQRVTFSGTVVPNRKTLLSASYAGYVKKLYVQVGEHVAAGAPVVSVVQPLSTQEEAYPMRAPFSGTVVQVLASEGQYVDPKDKDQSQLVRIDDLTRLYIHADVPEVEIARLKPGQEATIRAAALANLDYRAVIRHVALAAVDRANAGTINGKADFPVLLEIVDRLDGNLKPGMSVIMDIATRTAKNVLSLPQEFVLNRDQKQFVVTSDGSLKPVQIGVQDDSFVEIIDGVKDGEGVRRIDQAAGTET